MAFPELSVCREFSADRINVVLNHPEVRRWVGLPNIGYLDFSDLVADKRNYLLMAEGGGFFLQQLEPGRYEIHTQFLPTARGRNVVTATVDMQRYMFGRTECVEIVTKVPNGNVAATALVRKMNMEHLFAFGGAEHYRKTTATWAKDAIVGPETRMCLPHLGEVQAKMLGLALEMAAFGQIDKGLNFYRQWAQLTGVPHIALVAGNPLVFDIGEALIALRGHELEVLLCRQRSLSQ